MLVIAHVLLGFVATLPPELPLVLQGVAFAFFATALWPRVPYTVPAESEGLAKSPTPKSLLKKSRAIPGRADLRTFGRRASATDGALRVGGHVGL